MSAKAFLTVTILVIACLVGVMRSAIRLDAMSRVLHMNDFGKFYYSAQAFVQHRDMYAPNAATTHPFQFLKDHQFLNMNPPHFHLLVLPLALLPPETALSLWLSASIAAFMFSVLLASRELRFVWTAKRTLLGAALALNFAGTESFFATGQLSLLMLLPMTLCWLDARNERWRRAGVWLGLCLSVKPFLLIFFPYLLGRRRFGAIGSALMAAGAAYLVGVVVFGMEQHRAWIHALGESHKWTWAAMNASFLGFFSRVFDQSPYYSSLTIAPVLVKGWIVPACFVGLITIVLTVADRSRFSCDRAFALLTVASQLMSPLGWIYYMWWPIGPTAAIAMARGRRTIAGIGRLALAVAAVLGLMYPMSLLFLGQPGSWATATVGSAYFWGTFGLWLWLVVERLASSAADDVPSRLVPHAVVS